MMKKRTALFAGTALLSLAAATALYAVNGDNCITAEGCFNVNAASCTKKKDAYAGNDVFGDGAVPASEVDRIDPDADPKTATQAINNVGIVIDGAAPNGEGTDLDAKARAVRALIDDTADENIDLKLKDLAEELDGSNNLADAAGRRLLDKVNRIAELLDTPSGNLLGQVDWARIALDGRAVGAATTLNAAIANVIGGAAGTPASGFIGSDAVNGSGQIDGAASAVQKLQVIASLIANDAVPVASTVADALIAVQGDGTGGIIGDLLVREPDDDGVGTSMLTQLTQARNLIDGRTDANGPLSGDIDLAIQAVQGTAELPAGIIGGGVIPTVADGSHANSLIAGSTTIRDAGSAREKCDAMLALFRTEVGRMAVNYTDGGEANFTALLSAMAAVATA